MMWMQFKIEIEIVIEIFGKVPLHCCVYVCVCVCLCVLEKKTNEIYACEYVLRRGKWDKKQKKVDKGDGEWKMEIPTSPLLFNIETKA